jgi:hypothetical protein
LTVAEFEKATNTNRIPLKNAVEEFIAEASKKKRPKTVGGYQLNLRQFLDFAKSLKFLDEVSKQTLREFRDYLAARGYEPKDPAQSCDDRSLSAKEHRIQTGSSLTNDLPTFEEDPPVPFAEEELKKLFSVMTDEDRGRCKFFLGTAGREQEVRYATWTDVDFERMEFPFPVRQYYNADAKKIHGHRLVIGLSKTSYASKGECLAALSGPKSSGVALVTD